MTDKRPLLDPSRAAPAALSKMASRHPHILQEVQAAIAKHAVVVIGMAQNPHVRNVRRALREAGIEFEYLEYGSYLSKWAERLTIKMWSGWPTFPQVFHNGVLIGGEDLTKEAIAEGRFASKSVAGAVTA